MSVGREEQSLEYERARCRAHAVPVVETRTSASETCECFTPASVLHIQRASTERTYNCIAGLDLTLPNACQLHD